MYTFDSCPRPISGGRRILPLVLVLLVTSCGGGSAPTDADPNDPDPPDGPFTQVACTSVQLASTQGAPLDEISIGSLPSTLSSPVAVSVASGDAEHSAYTYILTEEDDEIPGARLLVPLHPEQPLEGGPVRLTITDGTRGCEPIEFTIAGLAQANGEFAAVLDLMQAELDAQATLLETTREELADTPIDELAPAAVPLALAQYLLDDPDNPSSLRALANGAASDQELRWLDGLLGRTDVRAALTAALAASSSAQPAAPATVSGFDCLPEAVSGAPPEVLHMCMVAAADAIASAGDNIGRGVADDIKKTFSTAAKHPAFTAPAGAVSTAFGVMYWVIYSGRERAAALLPSRFVSFETGVNKPRFMQDEDATGEISVANVTAANLGYDLQDEIEGGVDQATSIAKKSGSFKFSTGNRHTDRLKSELGRQVDERLKKPGNDGPDFEEFEIGVEIFGPVDVADPDWIQARVAAGPAVHMDEESIVYDPRAAGMSTIAIRTHDDKFGGAQIFSTEQVEVGEIGIDISPAEIAVEAGDVDNIQFVEFQVTVTDSKYPDQVDLDLDPHPEQGSAEISITEGGNQHTINYLAPVNPDYDKTDFVVVRHTAETGARGFETTEVNDLAEITFGSVKITPPDGCIALEAEAMFGVEVEGPQDETVEWSVDYGDIDQDGNYKAPATVPPAGVATIRAVSVANSDLEDEVTVPVGCTCQSNLTVAGQQIQAGPGDRVYFTDWGGPDDFYGNDYEFFAIVFETAGGSQTVAFPLDADPSTWPEEGVPTAVRAQGDVGLEGDEVIYSSDDEFPAIIHLTEYVPEQKAVGSVSAGVTIISTSEPYSTPATLDWTFAVTVPPGTERGAPLPPTGYRFGCMIGG